MSVGDAIFLSSLLLSVVGLYAATKDRWNWKRITKWALATPILLIFVLWGGIWTYSKIQDRPVKQTEFEGLRLGASESDVLFLKGKPDVNRVNEQWVYFADPRSTHPEHALLVVGFRDGKVRYVTYWDSEWQRSRPYLLGFTIGSDYTSVIDKLGEPSNVSTSSNGLIRLASFAKFNSVFEFQKGRVTRFGVFDSNTGPLRFVDEAERASVAPK